MNTDDKLHLCQEINTRLCEGRLWLVPNLASINLVCSPFGVVPKPHSTKHQTIYHLSHPCRPNAHLPSVNTGIHSSFVTIQYKNLDVLINFVHQHPGARLWKADLEDAFCHIIVAANDARLMGIQFDGSYCKRLRT
ncbi:uncharacterized protein UBRO_20780 [Ustilago bromivora]|uniref:Reverse transcriptase domain-containing protein n=1 Tax=Ustilago bromivora TaxID=307758 RepID=A0A1K0HGF4_9BASI|nr:uncharacterized protein UBRO_20780 [Ustilago bromivora]